MPRKSNVSQVGSVAPNPGTTPDHESTPAKSANGESAAKGASEGVNIEDLNLPKSIVTRLAKGVLPANTQIAGNATLAMTKSATVFVNFLASTANEHALTANRKTVSPQDVLKALEDLEFADFKPQLEAELAKFAEVQSDKRNTYRKKVAAEKAASRISAVGTSVPSASATGSAAPSTTVTPSHPSTARPSATGSGSATPDLTATFAAERSALGANPFGPPTTSSTNTPNHHNGANARLLSHVKQDAPSEPAAKKLRTETNNNDGAGDDMDVDDEEDEDEEDGTDDEIDPPGMEELPDAISELSEGEDEEEEEEDGREEDEALDNGEDSD